MNKFEKILTQKAFYFIADIGVNYYDIAQEKGISNMEAAMLMCNEAKKAGIDAIKFQTYKAGSLASKYSPSYWNLQEESTTSQYELFKKYDSFGKNEYSELKKYCDSLNLEFISTPFDFESVDYLDLLVSTYKISSSDITNLPFIEYIAKKNKTILISDGASELDEVKRAIASIRKYNNKDIVLMHCILEYPTPFEHANLNQLRTLKNEFSDLIIGYSDHTKPDLNYDVISTAFLLGAKVIEKHFTLNKSLKGNDHYHAMDVTDIIAIISKIEKINVLLGDSAVRCLASESSARLNARRSIVATHDLQSGTMITLEDFTFKRPGNGISPSDVNSIIGKKLLLDVKEDEAIQWKDIE